MKKYEDITFIIPLRCESLDRQRNLYLSLLWINKKYKSPVIVKESNIQPDAQNICNNFSNVTYIFEKCKDPLFHRTKLLNDMIEMCNTKYISNFDCDVIIPENNVNRTIELFDAGFDFVYPYGYGNCQKRVHESDWSQFEKTQDLSSLNTDIWSSQYGHCFFAKLDSYKKAFGENEEFLSYGPEDKERFFRFKRLGYQVGHLDNNYFVYHLEHSRTQNSWLTNPYFENNNKLLEKLNVMSDECLQDYYNNLDYVICRKWKHN